MIRDRTVARRTAPPDSALLGDLRTFYYWDSHEAPLARGDLAMHELYLSLFAHHPRWIRRLRSLRGWIVRRWRRAGYDELSDDDKSVGKVTDLPKMAARDMVARGLQSLKSLWHISSSIL